MQDSKHELEESAVTTESTKRVKLEEPSQRRPEEANPRPRGIQEEDVGITEYISKSNNGFSGILKQRYYDFLVNEIEKDGNVVHLIDEGVQNRRERRQEKKVIEKQYKIEDVKQEQEEPAPQKPVFHLKPEHRISLLSTIGEEDLTKIESLLTSGNNMEISKAFDNKTERGKLHQLLRESFEGRLESFTTENNTIKVALVTRGVRNNRRTSKNENRKKDREAEGDYGIGPMKDHLTLTVYKENKETMEVAMLLSKFLRIPTKWIGYAGTKDRRGVTCQRLSIQSMRVSRVNNLNKILKGIRIGSFGYSDTKLALGDLKGNEFVITIKDVQHYDKSRLLEDAVRDSVESLKSNGFINYFGMQRFGTFSISTHVVGVKLLLGKWKDAAELLLSEQELVTPESIEARSIWAETHDAILALRKMPRRCSAECSILEVLSREKRGDGNEYSDNSFFMGIMKIPRNLRIMYGHAYQSYVWNCVASKRIELFGLQIVEGDLVVDDETNTVTAAAVDEEDDEDFEEDVKEANFVRARPVTAAEIESAKFSVYDVVLPTPGFDIVYPANPVLRKVYEDVMAKDGLDPFNMSRRVREFSLAGSYRNLMGRTTNLEYYIRKYNSNDETLVKTDLDILRANQKHTQDKIDALLAQKNEIPEAELEKKIEEAVKSKDFPIVDQIEDGDVNGSKTALIIRMQLGVSAYATMALRELMKKDTSRRGYICDVVEA